MGTPIILRPSDLEPAGPTSDPNPPTMWAYQRAGSLVDGCCVASGTRCPQLNSNGRIYWEVAKALDALRRELTGADK